MNRFSIPVRPCVFVLALLLLGWSPNFAWAQTLYGITFTSNELITINTATGAGTLVGPVTPAPTRPFGIAFRGATLYSYTENVPRMIRELAPATGAVLATIDIGAPAVSEGDIVFRSDGIGFLTHAGIFGGYQLYSFDITVPSSTPIGPNLPVPIDGLAFNSAGVLYALEQDGTKLHTLDTTTGVLTLVGNTGIAPKTFPLAALAFDASDNLFGTSCSGGAASDLYSINTTTGVATLIGPIGFTDVSGLRFSIGGPPPVPGVTITESGGSTNVTEGGATDSYTVVLNTAPTANVTITISPGTQATVAPATLTFTPVNWNVAQTVTVTAVDDALVEGAHVGTITHTSTSADLVYNAIAIGNVVANITDNDVGPIPPPPTPGGGIDEGNYPGSLGLGNGPGQEGTFGFGRQLRTLHPFLKGPYRDAHGSLRVFNIANQQRQPEVNADVGLGVVGWTLCR